MTFFSDVITMASLKWCYKWFFNIRLCHDQFEKPQFGQTTQL